MEFDEFVFYCGYFYFEVIYRFESFRIDASGFCVEEEIHNKYIDRI